MILLKSYTFDIIHSKLQNIIPNFIRKLIIKNWALLSVNKTENCTKINNKQTDNYKTCFKK